MPFQVQKFLRRVDQAINNLHFSPPPNAVQDARTAQTVWVLGLGTQIVLGFLRIWVWVLGFEIWVLGGLLCTR